MKKKLLSILTFTLCLAVGAQNYYVVKKSSYSTPGYDFSQVFATSGTSTLLEKTSDDLMSATQTIPFSFNFYGNAVSNYKVSDNGYLTFNTTATASVASDLTPLPTVGGVNDAIYAFWGNFELKAAPNPNFPVKVISYTTGTAPNRVHHIQWFGVSFKGVTIAANADVYAFAISLHEGAAGTFDITYNSGYGSVVASGIIGAENNTGTMAKMLGDAASSYKGAGTSNNVYQFIAGTQPTLDAAMLSTNLTDFYKVGTSVTVSGEVTNYGSTAITSLVLNYTVEGGAVKSTPLTGLNIAANGENAVNVTSTIPWLSGAAGSQNDFVIWVSNPNLGTDGDTTNNYFSKDDVLRNNGTTVPGKVLFEEATGAWCQHCPDADVYMANLKAAHGDRLIVARHHNQDLMTNAESDKINAAYAAGYPSGYMNRTPFNVNGILSVGLSRGSWDAGATTAKNVGAPVSVNIKNVVFNNGKIDFTVEAEFFDYYAGDIRIGAMIKEDMVRGIGTGYDQIISGVYTTNPSHPLYQKKNPLVGYDHTEVIINIPSGAWGSANSVPSLVSPNQKVTFDYSYTLPAITRPLIPSTAEFKPTGTVDGRNKPANIWLIGFVAQYDADNAGNRRILNANERQMWNTAADVTTADLVENTFTLVPNTADQHVEVALNYNSPAVQNAKVTIMNTAGQIIGTYTMAELHSGMNTLRIDTKDFSNGVYMVNISGANLSLTQKLVITH